MYTNTIAKATFTPLSTAYLMEYLRATPEEENTVKKLALRAQSAFTKFTNGNVVTDTTFETFYDLTELDQMTLELDHRPVKSIQISYFDVDGVEIIVDPNEYMTLPSYHKIHRKKGWIFPNMRSSAALRVEYVAGRDVANVEDDLLAGLEQYTLFLYENRGDTTMTLPDSIAQLWAPYVIYRLGL